MGSGSFDYGAYTRSYAAPAAAAVNHKSVFRSTRVDSRFDTKKITIRESCDSEEHPLSSPIILGLDGTGSMGFVAKELVANGLGDLINGLYADGSVLTDPQVMLQMIGDVKCDQAPLQSTQFESDLRICEQLQSLWVEGGGGGNNFESYNLPWYFAHNYTKLDANARGQKGYLFTVGDESVPENLTTSDILRAFGENVQSVPSNAELLKLIEERYHVFHIIAEEGTHARSPLNLRKLKEVWPNLMGRRAIFMDDHKEFGNLILAIIRVNEGEDVDEVIASFQTPNSKMSLEYSLKFK